MKINWPFLACVAGLFVGYPMLRGALAGSPLDIGVAEFRVATTHLWMQGDIDLNAAKHFKAAMANAKATITTLHLNSDGGNVSGALDLAQAVEEAGVDTEVNFECSSGCFLAFVAGKNKFIGSKGRIGVHSAIDIKSAKEDLDSYATDVYIARWLAARNVPYAIIGRLVTTVDDLAYLTDAELKELGVQKLPNPFK